MSRPYHNWPIKINDKPRLDSFLNKLADSLKRKLSYVDVADLIFNHSNVVIDVITAEESAVNNNSDPLQESVPA